MQTIHTVVLCLLSAQPGPKAQDLCVCPHRDGDPGRLGGLRLHRYVLLSPQHQANRAVGLRLFILFNLMRTNSASEGFKTYPIQPHINRV